MAMVDMVDSTVAVMVSYFLLDTLAPTCIRLGLHTWRIQPPDDGLIQQAGSEREGEEIEWPAPYYSVML